MALDIKGVKQGDRSVVITMREVDVNKQSWSNYKEHNQIDRSNRKNK